MTKRRGRGEGSIYLRSDGRYAASMRIEGTGRRRKYFYGKTRAEVREKLLKAQLDQKQGKLATGPNQTVQQFLEHWLEEYEFDSLRQMQGSMSLLRCSDTGSYQRANYIRVLQSWGGE